MSGLIWAGIGKGIADAGTTFGSYMLKDIEDQRRREDEARREANAIKRAEESTRIKEESDARKAEELKQRVIKETAQAQQRATEIGTERAGRRGAQLEADAAAASTKLGELAAMAGEPINTFGKEQVLEQIRKDPALRESFRKQGLITGAAEATRDARLERADDLLRAAREIGAHSSVLDAYTKDRADTLREIAEENKETQRKADQAATNLRLEQQGRKTDALIQYLGVKGDVADRNAETAEQREARLAKGGGKTASSGGQPSLKNMTPERLSAEADILRKAADKAGGERKQKLEAQFDEVIAEMARRRKESPGAAPAPAPGASKSASTTKNYSNLWK
jgi:hypothetical protein